MKKKIWIWNHYASDMYRNRGGRHYWFAKNLIKKGFEVTIFCSNTFHNSSDLIELGKGNFYKEEKIEDINFIFLKTTLSNGNGLGRVRNMFDFYINLKKIARKKINRADVPDYILASSVHPLTMLAGVQIGRKYNIPCISEVRDLWPESIFKFGYAKEKSLIGKLLIKGEKYIYQNSDALIFTKPGDKDYLIEKKWDTEQGGTIDLDNVFYINNGIDLDEFKLQVNHETISDVDLEDNSFKIIYTGTIKPVNNIDLILDVAKYFDNEANIKFLIYGSGSEEYRIRKRIENENITNVYLKGRVNKKYIPFILSKSSVNLLNYSQTQYNWERGNSSNKLFEYMASGTPIISTVRMGYSIIDEYHCGFEIENGEVTEIVRAIYRIKEMNEKDYNKLSENALKGAQDFDFKQLTKELIRVLEKVK